METARRIQQGFRRDSLADLRIGEITEHYQTTIGRSSLPGLFMRYPKFTEQLGQILLHRAATGWFAVAAFGQCAFIGFILVFYGTRTASGNFSRWNDKPLIDGYIADDSVGNLMFISHVLLAALVTLTGLVQLVPVVRKRLPSIHRWSGRVFLSVGLFLAVGGIWLAWIRGTRLSFISAFSTTVNGVLIVLFAVLAWRYARRRQFAAHRRWALRTFMVVSGVWFIRIGLMGWIIVNQAPRGMNGTLSGPADIAITFGSYLIPLAVLECYLRAQRHGGALTTVVTTLLIVASTLFTAVGVFGTITLMWWPHVV
ncbi:MAG: DUF2306 domain-containing protein [Pseudomonadota bacterium]